MVYKIRVMTFAAEAETFKANEVAHVCLYGSKEKQSGGRSELPRKHKCIALAMTMKTF